MTNVIFLDDNVLSGGMGGGDGHGAEPRVPCALLCFVPDGAVQAPLRCSVNFPLSECLCPAGGRWGGRKEKADSMA